MKAIWYVAKKDLLQTVRDRSSIFFILIMPMIFITVMGLTLSNAFGNSGPIQVNVAITNQDNNFVGQQITQSLAVNAKTLRITLHTYSTAEQVAAVVADTKSNIDAGVVIPAGASDLLLSNVENHQPTNNLVKFYALPGTNNQPTLIAQEVLNSIVSTLVTSQYASGAAVGQVNQVCNTAGNHCAPATIDPKAINQAVSQAVANVNQTSPVQSLTAGKVVTINSFDLYVPGYAIFFALFSINAVAGTILQEKEDGTFRRLLIAPVQKYALLAGKALAQFVLTLMQMLILFGFGYLFFHIHLNDPGCVTTHPGDQLRRHRYGHRPGFAGEDAPPVESNRHGGYAGLFGYQRHLLPVLAAAGLATTDRQDYQSEHQRESQTDVHRPG